jgi:hypothetical protein
MAYDANGMWKDEGESTAARVGDLTTSSSPYIQQAKQAGLQSANRRGLLNSSISAGAAEGEAIKAAAPIAQADANVAAQRNLSAQNFTQQGKLNEAGYAAQKDVTGMQIAGQKDITGMQITSAEKQTTQTLANQLGIANLDAATRTALMSAQLGSNEKIALQNINANQTLAQLDAATKTLLAQMSTASNEKIATQQIDAQTANALAQINANKDLANLDATTKMSLAQLQIQAQTAQQQAAIASQEKQTTQQLTAQQQIALENINANANLAQLDNATKMQLAVMDSDMQMKIANLNVSANQQKDAMAAAINMGDVYAKMIDSINSNTTMPAAERAKFLDSAKIMFSNNLGVIEGMYGINLNWGGGPSGAGANTSTTLSPGMLAALDTTGYYDSKTNYGAGELVGARGMMNDFWGRKNNSPMQDIQQAVKAGVPITDAQWAAAGFGPGGAALKKPATAPAPA